MGRFVNHSVGWGVMSRYNSGTGESQNAASRGQSVSHGKRVAVIPAYNEAQHVGEVVNDLFDTGQVDEVVVVDDASDDETAERADFAGAEVLRNRTNRSNGGAIKRGYKRALELDADVVYRLDADGQHNPKNLEQFRDAISDPKCQYVLGNRFADENHRSAMPYDRLLGNRVVGLAISARTGRRIADPSCGFRAIDASYLRRIPFTEFADDFRIDIQEIVAVHEFGGNLRQVPVDCIYADEQSSLSYFDGLQLLFSAILFSKMSANRSVE